MRVPFHDEFVVHYKTLFGIVVAIGVGQIVLALYGGYLSALPLDPPQRRRHSWRLAGLGLFLVLLTIVLGYLNDRTQNESQDEANRAKEDLKTVRDKLDSVYGTVGGVLISMAYFRQEVKNETQGCATANPRMIDRKLDLLQQQLTTALPVKQGQGSPAGQGQTSTASGSSAVTTQEQTVLEEVHDISTQMAALDDQWQHGLLRIGQEYTGPYKMGGARPMPRTLPEFSRDHYVSVNNASTSAYLRLLPTIEQARHSALVLLGKGPAQAAKDQKEFEAANKVASSSPPVPDTIDNLYASQFRFHPMADYLQSIERDLGTLPRH